MCREPAELLGVPPLLRWLAFWPLQGLAPPPVVHWPAGSRRICSLNFSGPADQRRHLDDTLLAVQHSGLPQRQESDLADMRAADSTADAESVAVMSENKRKDEYCSHGTCCLFRRSVQHVAHKMAVHTQVCMNVNAR